MSVKIRLTRRGRKNAPAYRIVASESKFARDGRSIESLGIYDPFTKKVVLNKERLEDFVKNGAQVSKVVGRLIKNQTN